MYEKNKLRQRSIQIDENNSNHRTTPYKKSKEIHTKINSQEKVGDRCERLENQPVKKQK